MRKSAPSLFSRTRQNILAATLLQPDRTWFLSDLSRYLRVRPSSLQRELASLKDLGILRSQRQGNMTFYQANPDWPAHAELRGLLIKTTGIADTVRKNLEPLADRIQYAFIFGSFASGAATHASDLDLMLIGDIALGEIALPIRNAATVLGREINPKILSLREFTSRLAAGDHFLQNIMTKPRIFLFGNQHDLDSTAR